MAGRMPNSAETDKPVVEDNGNGMLAGFVEEMAGAGWVQAGLLAEQADLPALPVDLPLGLDQAGLPALLAGPLVD